MRPQTNMKCNHNIKLVFQLSRKIHTLGRKCIAMYYKKQGKLSFLRKMANCDFKVRIAIHMTLSIEGLKKISMHKTTNKDHY